MDHVNLVDYVNQVECGPPVNQVDPIGYVDNMNHVVNVDHVERLDHVDHGDQRIYISDRTHSTPQCLPKMYPRNLSPPALSDSKVVGVYYVYSFYTTDRAGRGCVGTSLEDVGGCCAFYH